MHAPVPGRKKIAWEGDKHVNTRTLRLLDRIGPVGRFDENSHKLSYYFVKLFMDGFEDLLYSCNQNGSSSHLDERYGGHAEELLMKY